MAGNPVVAVADVVLWATGHSRLPRIGLSDVVNAAGWDSDWLDSCSTAFTVGQYTAIVAMAVTPIGKGRKGLWSALRAWRAEAAAAKGAAAGGAKAGAAAGGAKVGGLARSADQAVADGIVTRAAQGRGMFDLGSASRAQAELAGRAWIGPGGTVSKDVMAIVSRDGLRQWRPPFFKFRQGAVKSNFERRARAWRDWTSWACDWSGRWAPRERVSDATGVGASTASSTGARWDVSGGAAAWAVGAALVLVAAGLMAYRE
jgi:hypothetical protein